MFIQQYGLAILAVLKVHPEYLLVLYQILFRMVIPTVLALWIAYEAVQVFRKRGK